MPGSTPIYGFPYPLSTDLVANYPALGQELAQDIEGVLPTLGGLGLATPTTIANSGGTATKTGNTVTFTGVSSVSLNGCFSASFDVYRIVTTFTHTGAAINLRFRASGTDNTASTYSNSSTFMSNWTGSIGVHAVSNGTSFLLNTTGAARHTGDYVVYRPFVSAPTPVNGTWVEDRGGFGMGGYHSTSAAYDGFTIIGTGMTGIVQVYGYKG